MPGILRRILTALTVAALGAALGGSRAWRSPGDLLTDEQARALVATATDDVPAAFVERFDAVFGYRYPEDRLWGSDDDGPGFAVVTINTPTEGYAVLVTRSRGGFEELGWRAADDPGVTVASWPGATV
ncbi:hypothetical protein [Actinoplanes philippinensis]|uniref:hypothetical protein n=1 Tax=Actinoplanes philippinensis TaxID=35752 RepID=UPI000B8495C7|nr:hypothetical protein [Actinoplanes philippinensis]